MFNQLSKTYSQLSKEEFLDLARKGKRVAVFREIVSDLSTVTVYQSLSHLSDESAFLEFNDEGCFTFLGFRPSIEYKRKGNDSIITVDGQKRSDNRHPIEVMKDFIEEFRCVEFSKLPHLAGSFVGTLGYDAIRYFEKLPTRHTNVHNYPEFFFQQYDISVVFDHQKGTFAVCVIAKITENPEKDYQKAIEEIEKVFNEISISKSQEKLPPPEVQKVEVDIPDEEFCRIVKKGQEYIVKGDAFQIVLSRVFKRPFSRPSFTIFQALKEIEKESPLLFYFKTREFTLIGASPEKMVSAKGNDLEIIPIAGTRPRGGIANENAVKEELLSNEKECAEHNMLVDLARNDLGIVSDSVEVKDYKVIQLLSHVMHIISRVRGKRKEGVHIMDVLRAAFPAGTLTGAPKIRAMEIIDELETSYRGFYGGGICIIDNQLNLQSYIMIRTTFLKDGNAYVRAGAGVVFDSIPQNEADETRHKSKGMLEAIRIAEEEMQ